MPYPAFRINSIVICPGVFTVVFLYILSETYYVMSVLKIAEWSGTWKIYNQNLCALGHLNTKFFKVLK